MSKKSKSGQTPQPVAVPADPSPAGTESAVPATVVVSGVSRAPLPSVDHASAQSFQALESAVKSEIESMIQIGEPDAPPPQPADAPAHAEPPAEPAPVKDAPDDLSVPTDEEDEDGDATRDVSAEEQPAKTEPPQATESEPPAVVVDEEDLDSLTRLSDEQLDQAAKERNWPKWYRERLGRYQRSRARWERENAELKAKTQAMEAEMAKAGATHPAQPAPVLPPTGITSREAELTKLVSDRTKVLNTIARAHVDVTEEPDGSEQKVYTFIVDGKEQRFSGDDVEAWRIEYQTDIAAAKMELGQMRRNNVERAKQLDVAALTEHPWMRNPADPGTQAIEGLMADYPVLAQIPGARMIIAESIEYRKTRGNGTKVPPPPPPPPRQDPSVPRPPRPTALPSRVNPDATRNNNVVRKFFETGDRAAGRELIANLIE